MKINKLVSAVEAVLFAGGDPISIDRVCEIFEIKKDAAEEIMTIIAKRLDDTQSGIQLVKLEDQYQLCSRKEYADYVKKAFDLRRKAPLSQAALEVLAVIAYNQPVTRAFVEQVRGVDCSGVVSTLIEKGLLEEKGRLELPGKPLLYGTTSTFLRCFSLESINDLPELPRLDEDADAQSIDVTGAAAELSTQMQNEMEQLSVEE